MSLHAVEAEQAMGARIIPFFEKVTETFSYLVMDPPTQAAAIIDPVLDYDPASGRINTHSADAIDPAASGIAAANPALHVPRLSHGRPRLRLRDDRRQRAGAKRPYPCRRHRRRVRRAAYRARCNARHAAAFSAVAAGQYARRRTAAA